MSANPASSAPNLLAKGFAASVSGAAEIAEGARSRLSMSNTRAYAEDWVEKPDSLDGHVQQFDYDAVDRALNGDGGEDSEPGDYERLATALQRIFSFILDSPNALSERAIAFRVIGLIWATSPAYFESSPSLAEIARRLGVTRAALSIHSAAATRCFGIRNRGQAQGDGKRKLLQEKIHE